MSAPFLSVGDEVIYGRGSNAKRYRVVKIREGRQFGPYRGPCRVTLCRLVGKRSFPLPLLFGGKVRDEMIIRHELLNKLAFCSRDIHNWLREQELMCVAGLMAGTLKF